MVRQYQHYTHEERLSYLKEFDESGQSVRAFCGNRELNQWTLGKWVKARRNRTGIFRQEEPGGHKFVEMRLPRLVPALPLPPPEAYAHEELITLQRGPWRVTVPRNVARQDLEQVIRALEAADAV